MSEFWRRVLDLDRIPDEAAGLHLGWERPFPAWLWMATIVLILVLVLWSYRGLWGGRRGRGFLATVRCLILLGLVILLAGPMLVVPRELIEDDWVIILLDRSQSLQIADVSTTNTVRISRDDQLKRTLEDNADVFAALGENHQLAWMGFDAGAFDLEVDSATGRPVLDSADGRRTALGPALEQALRRLAARPISGIIVFSDGRTTQPPGRALLRQLEADAVPVMAVPLGSPEPIGDLAIRRIDSPRRAFIHDKVPIRVTLDRLGPALERGGAEVFLLDAESGEVLDSRRIAPGSPDEPVTLTAQPEQAGEVRWIVRIVSDVEDLIEQNNETQFTIELVDRPLRVLFIDGYPRWEYRYIKDLLVREKSIDSSIMLLSADRDFAQEGNTPISRLPNSPEELDRYDVIIIGDVPADFFSPRLLDMIRDHVAERGAGLLWSAGPRFNPYTYGTSALSSLLPLRGPLTFSSFAEPVTMKPTLLAKRLGILRIELDGRDVWPVLSDPSRGWTTLRWGIAFPPRSLKPAAEPLAVAAAAPLRGEAPLPLVLHMRYGAGQTIFVNTDEIWRWRFGIGEEIPEQFWIQMIRMLGRDRLALSGAAATLTVSPRRVEAGRPVVAEARIFDAKLLDAADTQLARLAAELVDKATGLTSDLILERIPDAPGRYAATILPDQPGDFEIRLAEPLLAEYSLASAFAVFSPDDELQHSETDHMLLAQLARQTNGKLLSPADLGELTDLLPNRDVRTPMDITEPLWDTPLCFILFGFLLTLEWIGRKFIRLT